MRFAPIVLIIIIVVAFIGVFSLAPSLGPGGIMLIFAGVFLIWFSVLRRTKRHKRESKHMLPTMLREEVRRSNQEATTEERDYESGMKTKAKQQQWLDMLNDRWKEENK